MKSNNSIYSLIISAALFFTSCEKSINVNVPPQVSRLTGAITCEVGTPLYVTVGRTAKLTESAINTDLSIRNAQISVYEDDVLAETLVFDSLTYRYPSATVTRPGHRYKVRIAAPGYEDAEATETAPTLVPITRVERQYDVRSMDGNKQDAVILTFTDPPTTNDHYVIAITGPQDSFQYHGDFCVYSPDPAVESPQEDVTEGSVCLHSYGIFLRDIIFNGQERAVKFYVDGGSLGPYYNGTDSIYAHITLWHVSEAYYRHLQTLQVAFDAGNNPFAEPVNVHTNFTNGYGIFAIIAMEDREIR